MLRPLAPTFLASLLAPLAAAQELPRPATAAEASAFERTSSAAEVAAFLTALADLPHGDRLQVSVCGHSHGGRDLQLVRAALPDTDEATALRALVIASIHAGECEGKEAVQQIARELAAGDHEDLLRAAVLYFVPIYNVDGNEATALTNRPRQNGPDLCGERHNGIGLDLNRDFVKAEAEETRALLGLFERLDPHLFLDLHTTNGSMHGYHLTYAPPLSTNVDPAVATLSRALLDEVTAALQTATPAYRTFDYGNFETRDWDGGGAPESKDDVRGWWSYDHRARYGVNYFGLRNRIGVLSEAYSYCDFATRIAATRAFVLGVLGRATARRDEVLATCAAADRRLAQPDAPCYFGFDTVFAPPESMAVLVGECDRIELDGDRGPRFARKDVAIPEVMPVFRRFTSRRQLALPTAWALPDPPDEVVQLLTRHGVVFERVSEPRRVRAERFAVEARRKPKRPFQGHQELILVGRYAPPEEIDLPAGALWIAANQRLARLAAQLLEPQSEDSLSSWNFLEDRTADHYPVVRIVDAR
ncbi:MAG: M14 family metallopeptidase [Planctomycetota bacterium]